VKIQREIIKTYHCDICNTGYPSQAKAKQCEKLSLETPIAKIGDPVRLIDQRQCGLSSKKYIAKGKITEIFGPFPPDQEYELKWLGGSKQRLESHVLQYLVTFTCPHCNEVREHPVYAPEFVALNKPR
jgi:transcription elongation factor Elf1